MITDNVFADFNIVTSQISNLINTPIEQNFERLSRMAKRMFNVPIIAISLVNEKRQLAKPVVSSLDMSEIDLYLPFLNEFSTDELFVVEDATKNEVLHNNSLVTGEPHIHFFVSCPIFAIEGKKIGSLTLIDYKPRSFGLTDLTNLNDIVKLIETEIRDYRLSRAQKLLLQEIATTDRNLYTDAQTRAWNFAGFKKILQYQIMDSKKENTSFAVAVIDIDHLNEINQTSGKKVGDELLILTSSTILKSCRDADTIARAEEDDFIVIINAANPEHVKTIVNRIKENIDVLQVKSMDTRFTVTIGVAYFTNDVSNQDTLIANAKLALLKGKRRGRNQIAY